MSLGNEQRKFSLMIGRLIVWAYAQGYEITFGDAWAKTGHIDGSFHYKRLAFDLNLFKDGVYLKTTEDHRFLGEKWKSMGGSWGGDFKKPDGNHYSLGEN